MEFLNKLRKRLKFSKFSPLTLAQNVKTTESKSGLTCTKLTFHNK
jgi:hypothetical protein